MRRFLPLLAALAIIAAACGEGEIDPAVADLIASDASSSTTTTVEPTSTTDTSSPSTSSTTTTEVPEGMCGDLVPVVTDEGTTCVDPDASTTTIDPREIEWPDEEFPDGAIPPLLVARGTTISMLTFDELNSVTITPVLTTAARVRDFRQASDGTIVTVEDTTVDPDEPTTEVARYDPDGTRTVVAGATWLYDVGHVALVESMIVAVAVDEFGTTDLMAIPLFVDEPGGVLGAANDHEYGVSHADVFFGLVVVSAWADLTEDVHYVDTADGIGEPAWSPSDDLPYGEPPFVTAASWSSDGSELLWAEGPDWGFDDDLGEFAPIPREWRIRAADRLTGEIRLDWPVTAVIDSASDYRVDSIFDLGSFVIVNGSTSPRDGGFQSADVIVIDFTVEEPEQWALPFAGIVIPVAVN